MHRIISKLLFTFLISLSCREYTYSFNTRVAINVADEDSSSIIAEGAKLQLISNQFRFTEGPTVDKKGNNFLPISLMIKYGNMELTENWQCF